MKRRRTTAWQPILDGLLAERALDAIRAIADDRREPAPLWAAGQPHDANAASEAAALAGGRAGMAVFHAYLARWRGQGEMDVALGLLDAAGHTLEEISLPPGLYSGFSGVAWAYAHLDRASDTGTPADLGDIDDAVIEELTRPSSAEYDLVSGVVGLGVYALERLPSKDGARMLTMVLARLAAMAQSVGNGMTWHTPPELEPAADPSGFPSGLHNLGMAHGVPGVVALLGSACAAGFGPSALPLLEGSVLWVLEQQLEAPAVGAFPNWIAPGVGPRPARLAWCYGDAGIAAALLLAAEAADRHDWRRAALAIARRAADRSFESSGVQDAALCHGATGLGHIFNRLYQSTGAPWLRRAARVWFGRALDFRQPGEGIAGFRCWGPDAAGRPHWHSDPGLLTGTAGIALALLSAARPIAPEWDRFLLLSPQPTSER